MIKVTRLLLAGAAALALSDAGLAQDPAPKPTDRASASLAAIVDEAIGQDPPPAPEPLPGAPAVGDRAGILESLPQPRDLPASLFAPPPPRVPGFMPIDTPYFVRDPLLDGPLLPAPGWFGGAELQILKPHVLSGLHDTVKNAAQRANGTSTTVALPSALLDWTVAPRFFLGYRLPSGFGEFMVAYRFLGTVGSEGIRGPDGPAALKSRFAFNMIDLDYNSPELSLWPKWDMRWVAGARILTLFYDSQFNQPFDQAAAGSGTFQARQFNNLAGGGPHAALEVARHLENSGWSLYLRTDFASVFEGSHLGFLTRSTTLGPSGQPLFGQTTHFGSQDAPILSLRTGLSWQPSRSSGTRLFLGYQYERFWSLDRLPPVGNNPPSVGQVWFQGIVLQATINY
jgi:hypothetical protein